MKGVKSWTVDAEVKFLSVSIARCFTQSRQKEFEFWFFCEDGP